MKTKKPTLRALENACKNYEQTISMLRSENIRLHNEMASLRHKHNEELLKLRVKELAQLIQSVADINISVSKAILSTDKNL